MNLRCKHCGMPWKDVGRTCGRSRSGPHPLLERPRFYTLRDTSEIVFVAFTMASMIPTPFVAHTTPARVFRELRGVFCAVFTLIVESNLSRFR